MEYWVNYESIRLLDFQDKKLVRWEVSACQCRRCGFHPWSGKIPHSTKPMHHDYWACALKPLQERIPLWEVHASQLDGRRPSPPPLAVTREKPEGSAQLERKKKKKKTTLKYAIKPLQIKHWKKKTEAQIQTSSLQKASRDACLSLLFPSRWETPGSLYCILSGPDTFFYFSPSGEVTTQPFIFFFLNRIRPQIYRLKGGRGKWEGRKGR